MLRTVPPASPSTALVRDDLRVGLRWPVVLACGAAGLTVALAVLAPLPLVYQPAFLPAFLVLVALCGVLTGVMLVEQYRSGGAARLLVLSWAFTWSVVSLVGYAVASPGVAAVDGLAPETPRGAAWLWATWNLGFVLLLCLALGPWPAAWRRVLSAAGHRGRRVVLSHLVVGALATTTSLLAVRAAAWAATAVEPDDRAALGVAGGAAVAGAVLVLLLVAVVGVARRRRHGVELWALVVLTAATGGVVVSLLATDPSTIGWYGARGLTATASLVLLAALMHEICVLHRRVRTSSEQLADHNAALVDAQHLNAHLVAVVSHDLRTPLAGLLGYLELLETDDVPPDRARHMISRSQTLARRLARQTEDLLVAAGEGALEISVQRLDVRGQLDEAAGSFPDLDVRIACDAGLVVAADPLRVQQMLGNLLGNSAKYGDQPVTLTARADGASVLIQVGDAGPGVPDEFADRLFERYTRFAQHRTGGAGLGLSVVRDLALAHGGTARYDREHRTFEVRLPAGTAGWSTAASRPAGEHPPGWSLPGGPAWGAAAAPED